MKRITQFLLIIVVLALPLISVAAQEPNPPVEVGGIDLVYIGQLLQALILATVPVLAAAATKLLVEKARLEKAKLSQEQQWALDLFIKTVVYAAEQMQLSGFIDDKLDFAVDQVQAWLDRNKIYLDVSEIRTRIEAAVMTEFGGFEPEDAPPVG